MLLPHESLCPTTITSVMPETKLFRGQSAALRIMNWDMRLKQAKLDEVRQVQAQARCMACPLECPDTDASHLTVGYLSSEVGLRRRDRHAEAGCRYRG